MKKKKKNKGLRLEGEQTESQEITDTLTDLSESPDDMSGRDVASLLGNKTLKNTKIKRFLLMLDKAEARTDFFRSEEIDAPLSGAHVISVVGPYEIQSLKDKALEGLLRRTDRVLHSGSRWKPILEEFPEWGVHIQGYEEFSRTMEFTQTNTLTDDPEDHDDDVIEIEATADNNSKDELELEEAEELNVLPDVSVKNSEKKLEEVKGKLEIPVKEASLELEKVTSSPSVVLPKPSQRSYKKIDEGLKPLHLTLLVFFIAAGAFWFLNQKQDSQSLIEIRENVNASVSEVPIRSRVEWPASLQPQSVDSLYAQDGVLIRRLRPILRAYEAGIVTLSQADEVMLRRMADPASASWEIRKLAANQLAISYLSRGNVSLARDILTPIFQEPSRDFATLINMGLIDVADSRLAQAREAFRSALRTDRDMQWLSMSLLGMVEGLSSRWSDANKHFEDALRKDPNNPLIRGLWLQTLLKQNTHSRFQIQRLVTETLWSDPDSWIDSSIPAPVAGQLVKVEALDGFLKGAEYLVPDISPGQLAFVKWFKGRFTTYSPFTESLNSVLRLLEVEDNLQSQVLYAYVLKEKGSYDEASIALTKSLDQIESRQLTRSSWPWTLAGDVMFARSRFDQAITLFQRALNRNNLDYAAVHGLGITLRERGQYNDAEQKIREALALYPFFMPARLRVSRLEWHAMARVQ